MTQAQILTACKLACRVSSVSLDPEFLDLIEAAYFDLEISGIATKEGLAYTYETTDQLVLNAVKTFVKLHLGDLLDDASAKRLEEAYYFQKATLKMRCHSDSTYTPGGDES